LKAYERSVIWLDYLDSEKKREEGRRVPLNSCVRAPTLDELTEAARRLKLEPEPQHARFPRTAHRNSGYVSVKKQQGKQKLLMAIAKELGTVRGERTSQPKKV
jgi:signal recognition particle subunit SRP19